MVTATTSTSSHSIANGPTALSDGASALSQVLDALCRAAQSACAFLRGVLLLDLAQGLIKRLSSTSPATTSVTTNSSGSVIAPSSTAALTTTSTISTGVAFFSSSTRTSLLNDNSTTAGELMRRRCPYRPETDMDTTYVQLILSAPWLVGSTSLASSAPSPSGDVSSASASSASSNGLTPSDNSISVASFASPSGSTTAADGELSSQPTMTPDPEELVFHGDTTSLWYPRDQPLPVDDLLLVVPQRRVSAAHRAAMNADFAADPWRQALWAAKRMKQAAEYRAVAPRPLDPVTHECSCGWCPGGTSAYELCAAATIRRTMRSFGRRASSFGSTGAAVPRLVSHRSCLGMAYDCALPRFGPVRD